MSKFHVYLFVASLIFCLVSFVVCYCDSLKELSYYHSSWVLDNEYSSTVDECNYTLCDKYIEAFEDFCVMRGITKDSLVSFFTDNEGFSYLEEVDISDEYFRSSLHKFNINTQFDAALQVRTYEFYFLFKNDQFVGAFLGNSSIKVKLMLFRDTIKKRQLNYFRR